VREREREEEERSGQCKQRMEKKVGVEFVRV
jgi:hypothetical protein